VCNKKARASGKKAECGQKTGQEKSPGKQVWPQSGNKKAPAAGEEITGKKHGKKGR